MRVQMSKELMYGCVDDPANPAGPNKTGGFDKDMDLLPAPRRLAADLR